MFALVLAVACGDSSDDDGGSGSGGTEAGGTAAVGGAGDSGTGGSAGSAGSAGAGGTTAGGGAGAGGTAGTGGGGGNGGSGGSAGTGTSSYPPELPLDAQYTTCAGNDDCRILELGCCDDCNGGFAVAVNLESAGAVRREFAEDCGGGVACTERACELLDTTCSTDGLCELVRP